jgi:ketosteroid isomerase-like protein
MPTRTKKKPAKAKPAIRGAKAKPAKQAASRAVKTSKPTKSSKPSKAGKASKAPKTTSVMIEPKLKQGGPFPVEHGAGESLPMLAQAVVDHLNSGASDDGPLWDKFWSKDFVSIEGIGTALSWNGRPAVQAKCQGWMDQNQVLGCRATGPFLGATGFAVQIEMDVREKASGKRFRMVETAVYTVRNGKVVREEFMYGSRDEVSE